MTKVTAQMSVSLDGYYAGPRSPADPHDMAAWLEGPEGPGFFRVTRWVIDAMAWRERLGYAGGERSVNSQIVEETFAAAGAYVMGRRMFDGGEIPWGEVPPFRAPVFVVTHRDREILERQGGTSFTFVTDGIERAIGLAKDAAGGKDVAVAGGGTLLRQVLAAGLLDELELHIAPVLLGDGMRLFDAGLGLDVREGIELTPARVVETPKRAGIRQVGYVPDAGHSRLIERCSADAEIRDVVLTTEEEGVALAAGAWLGGQRAALLMQSSGVGNCINMLSLIARLPLSVADAHHDARRMGGVQSLAGADGLDRRAGAQALRGAMSTASSTPDEVGRRRRARAADSPSATIASPPCCCRSS